MQIKKSRKKYCGALASARYIFWFKCQMFSHILCGLEVTVIYRLFCGKVAEQKKLRKLTNADLAKMTGYRKKTIEAFMCGARESEAIAKAIAAALGIEL
jgi:hypothetical protein